MNVDAADVVGSWDDRFLPLLTAALGLSGPDEIVSVVIRDEDGEEDLLDGTRARKRLARWSLVSASLTASLLRLVEV